MEPKNKSQNGGSLRSKLLTTAADIISRQGLKKLTMRALSYQVGVSRTAPYRHFKNKDALLLAIAEQGFNELTVRYQKINRDTSIDSFSRLQNIGLVYIEFAIKNPGAYKLMFGHEITQHHRPAKLRSAAKETFNEYLAAVKAFQEDINMTSDDYAILSNYSWAAVHGLATLLVDGQIHVSGKKYGMPTLLTDDKLNMIGKTQSMMAFAKQTLTNFWDVVLSGVYSKGSIASTSSQSLSPPLVDSS
jgi:AcrR family transcriptional regulator